MGGDEFTVRCRSVPDEVTAEEVGRRMIAALTEPVTVPGGAVRLGLSVGVVIARVGDTPDDLLAAADAALYRAKQAGGGRVVVGP